MTKKMIQVRYVGQSTVRIIQPFMWDPRNDYIEAVPLEKAAELVTYPGQQFELVNPAEMPEIVSFVEGDSRPVEELKAKGKRKKRPSTTLPGGRSAQGDK